MRLHEITRVERIGEDLFRVSFRCANSPGKPWALDVTGQELLEYPKFRRRVLATLGIVFAIFPDERFHRFTNSPLGLPVSQREWDAAIQQAMLEPHPSLNS